MLIITLLITRTINPSPLTPRHNPAQPRIGDPILHHSLQSPFQGPYLLLSTNTLSPFHHHHTLGPPTNRHHLRPDRPGPTRPNRSGQINIQTGSVLTTQSHFHLLTIIIIITTIVVTVTITQTRLVRLARKNPRVPILFRHVISSLPQLLHVMDNLC